MRTQLFRTDPVLVDGDGVVVALKDLDGVLATTLYLENMDIPAALTMIHGSKNANLRFTAATAGDAGNVITVEAVAAPDQAFSVAVSGTDVVINLACDSEGLPLLLASEVLTRLQADPYVPALVAVSLAPGSDGSGVLQAFGPTSLSGGFDATQGGNVKVEHSPKGWPDFSGPWDESIPASNAFSGVAAGVVKAFDLDVSIRGIRITADMDGVPTMLVMSAQAQKKRI